MGYPLEGRHVAGSAANAEWAEYRRKNGCRRCERDRADCRCEYGFKGPGEPS